MAFLEQRIDARVTVECRFSVLQPSRVKSYGIGGSLDQSFGASIAQRKVNLQHGPRSRDQLHALQDAFYVVMFAGPYTGLRVKNWADFRATQANSKCTLLTGSTTELQLQRKHTFGGVDYLHPIKKPVNTGTLTVYRTALAGGTASISATIDYTTGIATISGHTSGDTYAWTGEFDLPMTFVENEWSAEWLGPNSDTGCMVSGPIQMEELKNP